MKSNLFSKFLGSFLSGLFRAVFPIVKKSTSALGQELLKSGVGVLNDVWTTGDLKTAQKKRGKELISNVSNRMSQHMFGSGYNMQAAFKRGQSKRSTNVKKTRKVTKRKTKTKKRKVVKKKGKNTKKKSTKKKATKKRNKQDIQDIFS